MIPDGIVDEVRARVDIVEIIGEHLPLKRAGKEFRALCPFHQEKTPSFYVVPAKGFYKCFGCGESGDAFSFLMKHGGHSFQDALRQVAARVGVEIPERGGERAVDDPHRLIYETIAFAADFYHRQLQESAAGARARDYLETRGIGPAVIERFQLGYAPDEWRALREAAHGQGIEDELLLEAGLIKVAERGGEPYDRQRDRVIFPITDARGRVIAFGGRLLGTREGAPKYLNSPETPVYHKGEHLYGLSWAKTSIRRERSVLVVEGYMDYVSLAAREIENVVAGLGTAMTVEQAALVARYTQQVLLLYDSDAAGLRATFRSADALLGAGVHPLVVTLPGGEDPDSVVRRGGAAALRPHLDAAVDVLDRKLQILDGRGYFSSAEGMRKAVDGLLPTLRATLDPMLRDIYLTRVAERTGVRRETLEAELAAEPAPLPAPARGRPDQDGGWGEGSGRGGGGRGGAREGSWRGEKAPRSGPGAPRASGRAEQRKLLLLILRDESRIPTVADALSADLFVDPVDRELFEELVRKEGMQGRGPLSLELTDPARARLEELLGDRVELGDGDRVFREIVGDIRAQALFERKDALRARMAESRGEEQQAVFRELTEVTQTLRAIGSDLSALGFKLSKRYRRYLRMNQP
jgi:DNA primase